MKTLAVIQLFCPFCDYILRPGDPASLKAPRILVCENRDCPGKGNSFVEKPLEVELEVLNGPYRNSQ